MSKNTHTYPKKEDLEIIVGDEKQANFYPRMKVKRWDNEVNFSVGVISAHAGTDSNISNNIEWDDGHGTKALFYEKEGDEFEFEIELASKPASNILHLSIETKGLDFFYQPPLTEKEILDGCERPENVVGSYAVYHSTMQGNYIGGNNYRAGKAFHIYRPYAIDAKGTKVWCDLNIDTEMQITIPQTFINNALYPIIVDPTFGFDPTSPPVSWITTATEDLTGSFYTSPASIPTTQSITVHCGTCVGAGNDFHFKGVVVLNSNKNIVSNGVTDPSVLITSDVAAWYTSNFGVDPNLSASTDYVLMATTDNAFRIGFETVSNQGWLDFSNSYSSPTNPTDGMVWSQRFAIYCTHSEPVIQTKRRSRKSRTCVLNMPLNEGAGDPHDSSGFGNNGTNNGADWVAGDHGWAMDFNGSTGYLNCGNDPSLSVENLMVRLWAKSHDVASVRTFMSKHYSEWEFRISISEQFEVYKSNGAGSYENDGVFIGWTNDVWHHLVCVFNASTKEWKVYRNGIWKATINFASSSLDNPTAHNLQIGRRDNQYYFDGYIDGVRIYKYIPTDAEILADFNATKARYGL